LNLHVLINIPSRDLFYQYFLFDKRDMQFTLFCDPEEFEFYSCRKQI